MKKVIIIGAGFAGLNAAKKLVNKPGIEVTIIDKRNYHLFQPLLYQVAMAELSEAEIATPIRKLFSGARNVSVLQEEAIRIDREGMKVITTRASYEYDYLIMAVGVQHSYFGNEQWEEYAPGLKNLEQAVEIRRRVLDAFEQAERSNDKEEQKRLLTFVVIGGGPTGVELAGAIGEMSRITLAKEFTKIDPKMARVVLVEGGPRILPGFHAKLSSKVTRNLESLGVQVWTSSLVNQVDQEGVNIGKERLQCSTVLWAAGVTATRLNESLDVERDRLGRVIVAPDLSVPGNPEIFVLGDQAHFSHGREEALPGMAPVAMQQGRHAAKVILSEIKGNPRPDFQFRDKGQMATIGKSKAIVEIGPIRFSGFIAWLVWLFVHIYYLLGFKNRIFVLFQWSMAWLSGGRGARLIVNQDWRFYRNDKKKE